MIVEKYHTTVTTNLINSFLLKKWIKDVDIFFYSIFNNSNCLTRVSRKWKTLKFFQCFAFSQIGVVCPLPTDVFFVNEHVSGKQLCKINLHRILSLQELKLKCHSTLSLHFFSWTLCGLFICFFVKNHGNIHSDK